ELSCPALDRVADVFGGDAPLRERVAAVEEPDAALVEFSGDGPGDASEGHGVSAVVHLDDGGVGHRELQGGGELAADLHVAPGRVVKGQRRMLEAMLGGVDVHGVEAPAVGGLEVLIKRAGDAQLEPRGG